MPSFTKKNIAPEWKDWKKKNNSMKFNLNKIKSDQKALSHLNIYSF